MFSDEERYRRIEACARAAHEVNRVYCLAIGDTSQVHWEDAPSWQHTSCLAGAHGVLAGNGPRESHESWLAEKRRTGWRYGLEKDPAKREHPCMVPYDQLSLVQQQKDKLFVRTVTEMALALGLLT